ncbi:PepSY-associated TM helix domain-containing protein [Pseudomonas cichorii]|uniref:PepSY-associated TM helix domain-containing protein n=1 Tax=Pseudomonas cichorii TaxID=36746 RepID=UPI001C8A32DB|nr:PepSY domain-containing protein [Pseudomonas cichorii]MBX8487951.1 PepSY domain-containing protein [Pseudomonas cichorii]MBX8497756.1 PepSY domain-containing protein [Pseudomonas cichorii]MBX8517037.1 PepSY domain-containing protein [Pseudomonas cichorii]MBX8531998.1 PepSY domain-containing protein [Pseudomonas cichorii]MBX8575819.1 PepSY domain-containing protein [Pseudomonas cichorii]
MSKKSRSKIWFLVHSWLALPIWFFVLIVCVTGTLAVVSKEIMWLANPEMRAVKPSDDAPRLTFEQIRATIERNEPNLIIGTMMQPDGEYFALSVNVTYPDGRSVPAYVNPYTGLIQGVTPAFDFRRFTRALHGWWLVPFTNGYSWGWYLVSILGLPMLVSLITGLMVYKKFWKGFLKPTLRLKHGARIFWGDFHRLSGIWSIWFIAVISITGTWFLIQALLWDNQISISSKSQAASIIPHSSVPLTADGSPAPTISLDKAIEIAKQRIPGLEASFISPPSNAYANMEVGGRSWYPLMYQTAEINPYSGEIATSHLLSDRNKLEFVTESMRPLHTGDFGGIWIKLIWAFFGLLLSMMVLSGLLIWSKRTALATLNALKRDAKAEQAAARKQQSPRPSLATEIPENTL